MLLFFYHKGGDKMSNGRSFLMTFKTKSETKGADQMMQKLNELNKKLVDNQYRQRDCNKAISEAQSAIKKLEKVKQEKGKLDEKDEANLKKLTATIEENKLKLAQLRTEQASIKNVISETSKAIVDNNKEWTVLKGTLANLSAEVLTKLASKLLEIGRDVISTGEQFSATMSEVQAISGATAEELQQLEDAARLYGSTTRFSATEAAEALKYMALAGWDVQTSLEALPGILDLAAASGLSLASASDMVTDYLSAFGLEASQAAYMADVLTFAQGNSNTSAQQLGEAWRNSAANLHAAGQDMETVTSILEAMANQGLKGSEAGNALAAMMRDITDKMEDGKIKIGETSIAVQDQEGNFRDLTDILTDVEKAVDGMGTAQSAAALQSTFTARSLKGINLVLNEGMDKISGYENALRSSQGAAKDAASTMNNNLSGDIKNLNSALDELKLKIFEDAEQPLRNVVKWITGNAVPAIEVLIDNLDKILPVVVSVTAGMAAYKASLAIGHLTEALSVGLKRLKDRKKEAGDASKAAAAAQQTETAATEADKVAKQENAAATATAAAATKESAAASKTNAAAKTTETAATQQATAAQKEMNLAMAANVIGIVITGIMSWISAIKTLVDWLNKGKEEAKEAAEEQVRKSQEAYDKAMQLVEGIEKIKKSENERIGAAQGEVELLKTLQEEYDNLRNSTSRSIQENERLDYVAQQIASTLGLTTEEIRNQAGAYRDLTLEINSYSEALVAKAQSKYYEDLITEAASSKEASKHTMLKAEKEYKVAQNKLAELKKQQNDLVEQAKGLASSSDNGFDLLGNIFSNRDIGARYNELTTAIENQEKIVGDLGRTYSDYFEAYDKASYALKYAENDYKNFKEENQSSASATQASAEALAEYNSELEQNTKLLGQADDALADTAEGQTELEKKLAAANAAFKKNQTDLKQARTELESAQNALQKEIEKGGDPKRINELKTKMDAAAQSVSGLIGKQTELQESIKGVKAEIAAESAAGTDLDSKMKKLSQDASTLRSEMNSLAGTLKQLAAGETLSLDALIGLTEKYPEYTDMLLSAAGNADAQKKAVELLFNAKKQDYILTQQAAIDNINASNEETKAKMANIMLQINGYRLMQLAILSTNNAFNKDTLANIVRMGEAVDQLSKQLDTFEQKLIGNQSKISQYQQRISAINKLTFSDFTSGSGSGGGTSSGSEKKETYWRRGKGIYAEGDSYIKAYENWMTRAKNLGRLTVQEEIKILEELLRRRSNTADEQYEIEYKLYQARSQLQKQQQEEAAATEKAASERLIEQQNLALAAFNKLTNAKIEAYQKEADAAKKAADAQIKAIDDVENKRKQAQEDDKRRKELEQIKAKLTYGHDLTVTERNDLQRRLQDILNEQYEANRERGVAVWKANIQSGYEDVQSRSQQAIEGLQAAQTGIADRVAYMQGKQSYDQRVSNNSKSVNIQLINNGLTADQAANRIVQKVLKELG